MEYRNLGRTGVRVSPLCVGCLMLGRETSEAESMEIVDRAIDRGINFFDTANMYGRGMSETVLGKAFARNGQRDRVVLATKAHFRMDDDDPNAIGNSRRHMIEQCEKSLRRLQTDHVDLFYVHRPESETPIDETLRALDDLVRAGKVRYIGCSMFTAWQIVESLWAAKEHGLNRFVAEQPPYNLLERRIERELVPCAQTYGIAIMSWSALAAGFLAGRYRRGEAPPPDSRHRGASAQGKPGEILGDASFAVLDVLEEIAGEKGCTPGQLALAWNMAQPGITSTILGPRKLAYLEDSFPALDVVVTDEDCARLDAVAPPGGFIVPAYRVESRERGADWGPHQHRW